MHENKLSAPHIDHQHTGDGIAVFTANELYRAVLLEPFNTPGPDLFRQAVDDFDSGQIPLMHRAVERLAGKSLLMHRAVRIAIEEAAEFVLEFVDTLHRCFHQRPRELLVWKPFASLDRVHEVALDGVFRRERDVVAALHHPCATAFAKQAFDRDGNGQPRVALMRVQRREEPRASGT